MYASNSTNWNENVLISLQIEFCLNIMYVPMWSHHKLEATNFSVTFLPRTVLF